MKNQRIIKLFSIETANILNHYKNYPYKIIKSLKLKYLKGYFCPNDYKNINLKKIIFINLLFVKNNIKNIIIFNELILIIL